MSPSRTRAKPLFDPNALDEDIDDMWPVRKSPPATPTQQPVPVTPPPASPQPAAPTNTVAEPPATAGPTDPQPAPPAAAPPPRQTQPATTSAPLTVGAEAPTPSRPLDSVARAAKRTRPPEVLLSAEVYDELYRTQIAEKKVRRGLARTMGAIVLDAIETHAAKLATTWTSQQYAVGEGQLFERPSSNAVPRRRRHATAPRTVVLSGVTAANGQRLDNLVEAWAAGTRSALVEQALRYEFDLLPG